MTLKELVLKIGSRLNKRYRVVVIDHELLSQSRFWMVKPLGLFMLAILGFLGIGALVGSLFVFTSVGSLLPGRANPELESEYKDLKVQTEKLKKQFEEYSSVINSLKSVSGIPGSDSLGLQGHSFPESSLERGQFSSQASGMKSFSANQGMNPAPILGLLNLLPPVQGEISRHFNQRDTAENHFGIDIISTEGSLIRAISDGVVIFSEYSSQTGYVIGVMHPRYNLVSFYKHNSRLIKKPGSFVFAGESIAMIGNSGRNQSGTHLHFELWYNGNPVDPERFIIF